MQLWTLINRIEMSLIRSLTDMKIELTRTKWGRKKDNRKDKLSKTTGLNYSIRDDLYRRGKRKWTKSDKEREKMMTHIHGTKRI